MAVEHEWKRRDNNDNSPDLVLTITITGTDDIYRFSHHMLTGQVEFVKRGYKIIEQLKRRMGAVGFKHFDSSMGGWRLRGDRDPREKKNA